jgi:hypothetical protein
MLSGRVFDGDGFAHYEFSRSSRLSNRRAIRAARVFSNSTLMSSRVVGSLYTCEIRMGGVDIKTATYVRFFHPGEELLAILWHKIGLVMQLCL